MTILLQGAGIQTLTAVPSGPVPLLDLEADTLTAGAMDTWTGSESDHHVFTATGAAQPTAQLVGGIMTVIPDGINDYMTGSNIADNLDSFCVIIVSNIPSVSGGGTGVQIMKMNGYANPPGWAVGSGAIYLESGLLDYIGQNTNNLTNDVFTVVTYVHNPRGTLQIFVNGVENSSSDNYGTFDQFSNTEPLTLFTNGQSTFNGYQMRALRIYTPALSPTDRAAVETELAARYGVTL